MQLVDNIKKNKKTIIGLTLLVICMPLIEVLIKVIFTYGTYVGTFIRNIAENGACF